MPDFKKISRMIKASRKERYIIIEEGVPSWVVLSLKDYEQLLGDSQKTDRKKEQKGRDQLLDEAMLSYQKDNEEEVIDQVESTEEDQDTYDPELYFEKIEEDSDLQEWDLSTEEDSEESEFDTIPF